MKEWILTVSNDVDADLLTESIKNAGGERTDLPNIPDGDDMSVFVRGSVEFSHKLESAPIVKAIFPHSQQQPY